LAHGPMPELKYLKRSYVPGPRFVDGADFEAQLEAWNAALADHRIGWPRSQAQPVARPP
jgi:hypothetical protein